MNGNKFTENAQNALNAAFAAASELGHNYVGSEHLLLGLLSVEDSAACKALTNAGITPDLVKDRIKEATGFGQAPTQPQDMTPRTKMILQLAGMIAANLGHGYIGTEHLLLGLFREGENIGLRIILAAGADPNMIARELFDSVGSAGDGQEGPSEEENEQMPDAAFSGNRPAEKSGKNGKGGISSNLAKYGKDLTEMARQGKIDPIIGREEEINHIIRILSRRTKNNPCLVGEPGVGKTAVVEGLATLIINGDVPENMRDKILFSLNLSSMVAGSKYRGEFEERIKNMIDEIIKAENIILFIDEIHTLIGAGGAEGAIDAANILKPALSRGEIKVIGATTRAEYRKHIEKDAALERRFQPVNINEPSAEDAVKILLGLRDRYEAHHKVSITDESINAAVELSSRYIPDRYLPDKAIDLIDEAASRVKLRRLTPTKDVKELEAKLAETAKEKEEAIRNQNFEKAASLRDREKELHTSIDQARSTWSSSADGNQKVTESDIADIVSGWTGIPVSTLTQTETERLLKMEEILHRRVIGQDVAVSAVSRAIRRGRVGLKDPKRPIGSFIFLGPTGVGKTELCKALAEALFGDENALIRIDMSEYMEKFSVSRLIGSPPGYVGYEEGGQLTEKVRTKPYSVILFDEIEKAHPDVFNILLQLLDDGQLTDSQGTKVNFKNTIIVLTSNLGAKAMSEKKTRLGFGLEQTVDEDIKKIAMTELKDTFRPEFLNRLDDIIVFNQLTREQIGKIAEGMLKVTAKRISSLGVTLTWSEEALMFLADAGFDPTYGARPLKRAIQSKIEDLVSEKILDGSVCAGDTIRADVTDGSITVSKV